MIWWLLHVPFWYLVLLSLFSLFPFCFFPPSCSHYLTELAKYCTPDSPVASHWVNVPWSKVAVLSETVSGVAGMFVVGNWNGTVSAVALVSCTQYSHGAELPFQPQQIAEQNAAKKNSTSAAVLLWVALSIEWVPSFIWGNNIIVLWSLNWLFVFVCFF